MGNCAFLILPNTQTTSKNKVYAHAEFPSQNYPSPVFKIMYYTLKANQAKYTPDHLFLYH